MSNHESRRPAMKAALIFGALLGALSLSLAASCSVVFRSSIQGTVIDWESWDDGTTVGVADAKVFLYTDLAARDQDLGEYVEGDESTLPDRAGKAEYLYFQSTVTDADGSYDFTGFIWEKFFSEYGKTADRTEVFLLIHHPDYGLWKNPVPLYVVSDNTNQLPQIAIEDLWNQGRLAGTVLNWKDSKGLGSVSVNFYVATSWTYDANGNFENVVYPRVATATTTTDDNGAWAATVRFPMKPTRTAHAEFNTAPVRVSFVRENYRANDPADGTGLANTGLVVTVDRDNDGVTPEGKKPDGSAASFYDYEDAFVVEKLEYDDEDDAPVLKTVANITMQRWRFSTTVRGRVKNATTYVNGVKVALSVPTAAGETYTDYSEAEVVGDIERNGVFNLGTIQWEISDIEDVEATRKSGEVTVVIRCNDTIDPSGDPATLLPDESVALELVIP